jgi:integrase
MKKTWPLVRPVINNETKAFLVDARINGKGERRFFGTRAEAKVWADQQRANRMNQGSAAVHNAELASYGWNVSQAIDLALDHLRARRNSMPLVEVLPRFLEDKRKDRLSPERISELKRAVSRLIEAFPSSQTGDIKTKDINEFLRGLDRHNTTRMNYRRDLHAFFEWCAIEELIDQDRVNPVARAASFDSEPEREVITAQQFERLLLAADDIIRPAFILGGFCGIRQAEISRLDWRDIDLVEKVITISAKVAKGSTGRRTVTIPEPALAWLRSLARQHGPVLPPEPPRAKGRGRRPGKFVQTPVAKRYQQAREAWDMARLRAGFGPFGTSLSSVRKFQAAMPEGERNKLVPWPDNCLRHSAISNRLALSKIPDIAAKVFGVKVEAAAALVSKSQVADDAGNSVEVIKEHYDALSKPDTARRWFSITPPKDAKVIEYSRAIG